MTASPSPIRAPIRGTDPALAAPWLDQLARVKGDLPGAALPWIRALREEGAARFAAVGLPTVRTEAWKYTSLRALEKIAFEPAAERHDRAGFDTLPTVRPAGTTATRLVFVNGRFRPELSTTAGVPAGVELSGLGDALGRDGWLEEPLGRIAELDPHPLVALNTAFLGDGAVVRIARGVEVPEPIELVYVSLGSDGPAVAFHPRTLIVAEPMSRAVVVEHHIGLGDGATLANHVAEVSVGEGAALHHYKVQREGAQAFHLAHTAVRVARDGCYDSFILTAGARLSRNEVRTCLGGTGASCRLNGAYMVRGDQHVDTTTFIDHAEPHGSSREVYKGAVDDTARAVFQGKILVRRGAQKTDGHQLNRALLLSDTAEIDSKPELEIYADDVKCSHGATAGELADEQLFYLRARGIPREEARGLLIAAFLAEAIDEIPEAMVRERFQELVAGWLDARNGQG